MFNIFYNLMTTIQVRGFKSQKKNEKPDKTKYFSDKC